MSVAGPALLGAAAGVAFGHAVLPDHWAPLAVLGRARRYPLARVARLAGLAGIAHVLVSLVLGAAIIAVGLHFRSAVQGAEDAVIGGLLIATGVGFALFEITPHGHHAHDHGNEHEHHAHGPDDDHHGLSLARVMVPFGAAASPDLTILPVFLAATAAGVSTAILSLVIFAAVTIATMIGLTLLACFGGYQFKGEWLERWGNALTAFVLILIGALIAAGTL